MIVRPSRKSKRVYVTVKDGQTKKSRSITIYEATAEQVIHYLRELSAVPKETDLSLPVHEKIA